VHGAAQSARKAGKNKVLMQFSFSSQYSAVGRTCSCSSSFPRNFKPPLQRRLSRCLASLTASWHQRDPRTLSLRYSTRHREHSRYIARLSPLSTHSSSNVAKNSLRYIHFILAFLHSFADWNAQEFIVHLRRVSARIFLKYFTHSINTWPLFDRY
jgi:hypothetical protein